MRAALLLNNMKQIRILTLLRWLAVLNEAIKDCGEQEWWRKDNPKTGIPLETLEEVRGWLEENSREIVY